VMWRRKRQLEDQKTIDALSRANARLTADLETMVGESERLKEEVRQRDEVIAGLRKELKTNGSADKEAMQQPPPARRSEGGAALS
jgi:hypothetical protein